MTAIDLENDRLLKVSEVARMVGMGVSTIYQHVAAGTFPKPLKLGPQASRWLRSEVQAWVEKRVSERESEAA